MSLLDRLPSDRPIALLLRHAERPELPPDPSGHAIALTVSGVGAAAALGERLRDRLRRVHTSPIRRCVETAEAIAGARSVVRDLRLGDPGPFVADLGLAWSEWQRLGHDGVLARLVSGVDEIPGLHPLRATASALAGSLLDTVGDEPSVHLFVTHDVVLAPLVSVLLDRPLARGEWPAFLEPFALVRDEAGVEARYRESLARASV